MVVDGLEPGLEVVRDIYGDLVVTFFDEPGEAANMVSRVFTVKLDIKPVIFRGISRGKDFHNSRQFLLLKLHFI